MTPERMRALGMTEQEIRRATCEHDYGDRCEVSPIGGGCVRTCVKCGQMMGLGRHCWEQRTTSPSSRGGSDG